MISEKKVEAHQLWDQMDGRVRPVEVTPVHEDQVNAYLLLATDSSNGINHVAITHIQVVVDLLTSMIYFDQTWSLLLRLELQGISGMSTRPRSLGIKWMKRDGHNR